MNNDLIHMKSPDGDPYIYLVEICENYYFKRVKVIVLRKNIEENKFEAGGSIINGEGRNDGILVKCVEGPDCGKFYKIYPENFIKNNSIW